MAKIYTAESFSIEVEQEYLKAGGKYTYLEIASELMTANGIDPEDGGTLISSTLKEKIRAESRDRNLLKERSTTRKLV